MLDVSEMMKQAMKMKQTMNATQKKLRELLIEVEGPKKLAKIIINAEMEIKELIIEDGTLFDEDLKKDILLAINNGITKAKTISAKELQGITKELNLKMPGM